jgi:predicted Zn-dependent protease
VGGDRAQAEKQFRRGLEVDPHFTSLRVDLARLLIVMGRPDEARRELTRVLEERAPTNLADWTVKDRPRARELLESLRDKK